MDTGPAHFKIQAGSPVSIKSNVECQRNDARVSNLASCRK